MSTIYKAQFNTWTPQNILDCSRAMQSCVTVDTSDRPS